MASYENYKLDVLKSSSKGSETSKESYIPDEETLKLMYEAAKNDKIQSSNHQSHKFILINSFLIGICFILFFVHWGWMRRIAKSV